MANWSEVLIYLHMRGIHVLWTAMVICQCSEEEEHHGWNSLAVSVPSLPHPLLSTVYL